MVFLIRLFICCAFAFLFLCCWDKLISSSGIYKVSVNQSISQTGRRRTSVTSSSAAPLIGWLVIITFLSGCHVPCVRPERFWTRCQHYWWYKNELNVSALYAAQQKWFVNLPLSWSEEKESVTVLIMDESYVFTAEDVREALEMEPRLFISSALLSSLPQNMTDT